MFIVRGSNNVMSKICFMASSMLSILPRSVISLCFHVLCVCPSPWQEHCCKPVPLRKCLVKFQVMCKQSKQFQELLCDVCCPQLTLLLLGCCFVFFFLKEIWQSTPINNFFTLKRQPRAMKVTQGIETWSLSKSDTHN